MSSKVQGKKTVAANAPEEDRFRSGRARFGLQQLRRGRDKRWHFAGQQPDETVRMVVRRHKFFLLTPALPLLGSFILLGLVLYGATSLPNPLIPWPFFEILAIAFIIGTAAWFVYKDFLKWYLETSDASPQLHDRPGFRPDRPVDQPAARRDPAASRRTPPDRSAVVERNVRQREAGG